MTNPFRVAIARLSTLSPRPPPLPFFIRHDNSLINSCAPPALTNPATDPRHPLHHISLDKLRTIATHPLRWYISTPLSVSGKATVRNWAKRRVQAAMLEALAAKGWDEHGRSIAGNAEQLKGWVKISADRLVVEQDYPLLRRRMDDVVRGIVSRQPKTSRAAKVQRPLGRGWQAAVHR